LCATALGFEAGLGAKILGGGGGGEAACSSAPAMEGPDLSQGAEHKRKNVLFLISLFLFFLACIREKKYCRCI